MGQRRGETELHRRLVRALIRYFEDQGWDVLSAASEDYPEPPAIGRHEPDVVGRRPDGVLVYGEAKTGEGDLDTDHSREQYVDFSQRVMKRSGVPCPFYICIPKDQVERLRRVLGELGVLSRGNVHILTYG